MKIRTSSSSLVGSGLAAMTMLTLVFGSIAAWVTHVIWAVRTLMSDAGATAGQIVLAALGTFVPPVGTIHGLVLWFS